jgi:hypothetical protein
LIHIHYSRGFIQILFWKKRKLAWKKKIVPATFGLMARTRNLNLANNSPLMDAGVGFVIDDDIREFLAGSSTSSHNVNDGIGLSAPLSALFSSNNIATEGHIGDGDYQGDRDDDSDFAFRLIMTHRYDDASIYSLGHNDSASAPHSHHAGVEDMDEDHMSVEYFFVEEDVVDLDARTRTRVLIRAAADKQSPSTVDNSSAETVFPRLAAADASSALVMTHGKEGIVRAVEPVSSKASSFAAHVAALRTGKSSTPSRHARKSTQASSSSASSSASPSAREFDMLTKIENLDNFLRMIYRNHSTETRSPSPGSIVSPSSSIVQVSKKRNTTFNNNSVLKPSIPREQQQRQQTSFDDDISTLSVSSSDVCAPNSPNHVNLNNDDKAHKEKVAASVQRNHGSKVDNSVAAFASTLARVRPLRVADTGSGTAATTPAASRTTQKQTPQQQSQGAHQAQQIECEHLDSSTVIIGHACADAEQQQAQHQSPPQHPSASHKSPRRVNIRIPSLMKEESD